MAAQAENGKASANGNGSGTSTSMSNFKPLVAVVDFHHARGPEIETWINLATDEKDWDPAVRHGWEFLPFMALSDGSHSSTEEFSYFTLRSVDSGPTGAPTSLFGISCTRQIDSTALIDRPADVTRSTVQKAVVVILNAPWGLGRVREKLSAVTGAWFGQKDFKDREILKSFQESLEKDSELAKVHDQYWMGLSMRELIYEFRHQTLVLFKCCLLQPKMLFFGSRCERLCMYQFALISLVPGLMDRLEDAADPEFDSYQKTVVKSATLNKQDRASLLKYMGLPLQLFGKGSMFCPYIPLQELDVLADTGTRSYIVGSTNSLLLQQKDRYSDILINLDDKTVNITSPSLRAALALTVADRRWIDFLTQTVVDSWDENHPDRPKTMGYVGSEEFIRLQFEEYLLAMLASIKYHLYLEQPYATPLSSVEGDPIADFGTEWNLAWQQTTSYALFDRVTDWNLFNIVEPRHPTAGNLTIDDVSRRVTQQLQTLHLDEKFAVGKETFNKHFATGQKKVSSAFATIWADLEARKKAHQATMSGTRAEAAAAADGSSNPESAKAEGSQGPSRTSSPAPGLAARAPELASSAQASVQAAGQKAGAYLSSWGSWATDKKKEWATKQ